MAVLSPPVVLLKSARASAGGVLAARGVSNERTESAGGVVLPVVLLRSALTPLAALDCPRCCYERIDSVGDVEVARGVARSPMAVLKLPVVLSEARLSQTGVALRPSNPRQRERENERSHKDGEKRSSVGRMAKHIKPSLNNYLKTA